MRKRHETRDGTRDDIRARAVTLDDVTALLRDHFATGDLDDASYEVAECAKEYAQATAVLRALVPQPIDWTYEWTFRDWKDHVKAPADPEQVSAAARAMEAGSQKLLAAIRRLEMMEQVEWLLRSYRQVLETQAFLNELETERMQAPA